MSLADYTTDITSVLSREDFRSKVFTLFGILAYVWEERRRVYICGNGGSGATASHFAGDLRKAIINRVAKKPCYRIGIRSTCISDNVPYLTAVANDVDYKQGFASFLCTDANEGDVLVTLSGSGDSPNIMRAIEEGKLLKMITVSVTGNPNSHSLKSAFFGICLPHPEMRGKEDLQSIFCHTVVGELMKLGEAN